MNKIIIGVFALLAIGLTWFILNPGDTFDYVVTIENEVTELENELAELDAQLEAGTLTDDEATAAKIRIVNRLNTINDSAEASQRAELTTAQRVQLSAGLDRLRDILVEYQTTLMVVDSMADQATVTAEVRTLSTGRTNPNRQTGEQSLNDTIAEIVESVEEIQETVNDMAEEEEEEEEEEMDNTAEDTETATSSEDAEGTTEDESASDGETATTSEETTSSTEDETDTETEATTEAQIEVTP